MQIKRTLVLTANTTVFLIAANILKYVIVTDDLGRELLRSNSFIGYSLVKNTGAAFGLFQGFSFPLFILAVLIVLGIALYVLLNKFYMKDSQINLLSVLCAGILGNAIERFMHGYVLDFIKFKTFDFPVFNINDIMISVSAFILIICFIIQKKDEYFNDKEVDEDIYYDI